MKLCPKIRRMISGEPPRAPFIQPFGRNLRIEDQAVAGDDEAERRDHCVGEFDEAVADAIGPADVGQRQHGVLGEDEIIDAGDAQAFADPIRRDRRLRGKLPEAAPDRIRHGADDVDRRRRLHQPTIRAQAARNAAARSRVVAGASPGL